MLFPVVPGPEKPGDGVVNTPVGISCFFLPTPYYISASIHIEIDSPQPILEQHLGFGSEKRTLKAIRQGRREACEEIICRHYESVYNLLVYLSGDKTLSEDLTQETFASAWAGIGKFRAQASIRTWLHRIAYNKFIDSKRTSTRLCTLLTAQDPALHRCDCPPGPHENSINGEQKDMLYLALDELQLPEYVVIVLHYIGGFSFREISVILDKPVGTVKWRISQALKKLESTLNGRIEQ